VLNIFCIQGATMPFLLLLVGWGHFEHFGRAWP